MTIMTRSLVPFVVSMGVVLVLSNVLVQYPMGNWLTYGALTYPFAFLVTDITTRLWGESAARRVILFGFVVGILCSAVAAMFDVTTARIAFASGLAFIVAQLLDVKVFMCLRELTWWKTPFISSSVASVVDTTIFFFVAFSAFTFALFPDGNVWALEEVPLLGFGPTVPLWVSLALADLLVKFLILPALLLPYRALTKKVVG